jgi:hypothetical protein
MAFQAEHRFGHRRRLAATFVGIGMAARKAQQNKPI